VIHSMELRNYFSLYCLHQETQLVHTYLPLTSHILGAFVNSHIQGHKEVSPPCPTQPRARTVGGTVGGVGVCVGLGTLVFRSPGPLRGQRGNHEVVLGWGGWETPERSNLSPPGGTQSQAKWSLSPALRGGRERFRTEARGSSKQTLFCKPRPAGSRWWLL
jgi:hypothetical protein